MKVQERGIPMTIEVVGKNGLTITPAIENYAKDKLSKLEKFFTLGGELNARVLCKVYNDHHKVEVTIPSKHFTLRTEVADQNVYAAIDLSVDKLERQIKKFKGKVNKILREREGIEQFFVDDRAHTLGMEKEYLAKHIVRSKSLRLRPMSVEEAIDQLEMIGHDFYIFLDETKRTVSVLYVRGDGDYALIETE
jgi:putative sigma-54 modulation protein